MKSRLNNQAIPMVGRYKSCKRFNSKAQHYLSCYMMILPTLIGFLAFSAYPIGWAVRYAFYEYDGISAAFVGLDNFARVLVRDKVFWEALSNTFILTFGKLIIELPLALFLAIVLSSSIKMKSALRTIYFLPNIISVAIMGLIFYFMFDTVEGIVNQFLMNIQAVREPVNWFGEKWTGMAVIASASIWQGFGVNMLFLLSGVQSIPKELYECASLDGAGKIRSFWSITLPMLAPVMQVVFMLAMVGTMQTTDLVLVLTNGQPAGKTEVIMTYIFKHFFTYGEGTGIPQYGYATAMSVVLAIVLGTITLFYLKTTSKKTNIY